MTRAQFLYCAEHRIAPNSLAWEPGEIAVLPDGRLLHPDGAVLTAYTCDFCGQRFGSEWTDDDATAEYVATYGEPGADDEPLAVMCDRCYQVSKALGYVPTNN